jgi:hypothetical protein
MYVCTYVRMYVMYVRTYVCMYVRIINFCMYIYIYIYIYICTFSKIFPFSPKKFKFCLSTSLMKERFFVTYTIRHTEIPALLDSWARKHTFVFQNLVSTKIGAPYIFVKDMTCLNVGLLRMCQVCVLSPLKLCSSGLQQIDFL